jgi:multidrug efflux pump subunit AcrB
MLIAVSLVLPALGLVVLKMLPFDNKSELQVVVDMPVGTPVEKTAARVARAERPSGPAT